MADKDKVAERHFIIKQRAIIKLYMLGMIEKKKEYATQYFNQLIDRFDTFGFRPSRSEIYKCLHELSQDGVLHRIKKIKGDPNKDFQEVVLYQFTESGYEKSKLFKKQVKVDLDSSIQILKAALRDNY